MKYRQGVEFSFRTENPDEKLAAVSLTTYNRKIQPLLYHLS